MPGLLYHCLKYLSPPISTQRRNRLLKFYVSVSILGKSTKKLPFFFFFNNSPKWSSFFFFWNKPIFVPGGSWGFPESSKLPYHQKRCCFQEMMKDLRTNLSFVSLVNFWLHYLLLLFFLTWTISWKCPQIFHFIVKIKRNIKEKYCQRLIFLFLSLPLDLLRHIRNPSQYNFDIYHQYTEGPFLCYKLMGYSSALTFLELLAIIMYGVFSSFCFCGSEFLFVFSLMSDFSFLVYFHFLYFINKVFLSQKKNICKHICNIFFF